MARSGRANQRSSKLRPPSRSSSAATAVFGAAPGSSSTRTCAPRDAALFSASIRRRSLKRGAANPISSPAAAAPSASSSAPRIAPSVRNRASMEPGPRGTARRRRGQAVVAARPCGDLELAGDDVAREAVLDLQREIPAGSERQEAHPAAGTVIGNEEPALIRLVVLRAQRCSQARIRRVFVERIAPPAEGEPPERRVERNTIAQTIETHARDDHAGPLEGLEIFHRRAAIGLATWIGHEHDLDVRSFDSLQKKPTTQGARQRRCVEHDQLARAIDGGELAGLDFAGRSRRRRSRRTRPPPGTRQGVS